MKPIKEGRVRIHWDDGTSHDMSLDPMRPIQFTNPQGDVWSLGSCDRWMSIEQLPPVLAATAPAEDPK